MEAFGAVLDDEWESLSKMFSFEDSDFFLHCDGGISPFSKINDTPLSFLASCENLGEKINANVCLPFVHSIENTNPHCVPQESSNSSGFESVPSTGRANEETHFPAADYGSDFILDESYNYKSFEPMQQNEGLILQLPIFSDEVMGEILELKVEMWNEKPGTAGNQTVDNASWMQIKRKFEAPEDHAPDNSSENPKKKPRSSRDANKSKRSSQPKKSKKGARLIFNNDEETNNSGGGINGQQSSSTPFSSEENDHSNELNNGSPSSDSKVLVSNGKTKSDKSQATDPQSVYARKRRERINERLKILQTLVPNGTKVDISTMLEEAVHYVKFLQLQIKLLSSDDLWMYAPIAYNGMDIGLPS